VKSWAVAILLLHCGVEPLAVIGTGASVEFRFPAREASRVLDRYSELKQKLNRLVAAAEAR
jgi:hypothetical protein